MKPHRISGNQATVLDAWKQPIRHVFTSGPVRAGKTWSVMRGFLTGASQWRNAKFVVMAKTARQLQEVIEPEMRGWLRDLGLPQEELIRKREAWTLPGLGDRNTFIMLPMGEGQQAYDRLLGFTLAGSFVDEAVAMHPDVMRMLITRCSLPKAQMWWTTNPRGPFHPFKVDYIDQCDKHNGIYVPFGIDDNPVLDQDYKDYLRKSFVGSELQRMYYGRWVAAAGAVWPHTPKAVRSEPLNIKPWGTVVSIDYASSSVTHAVLGLRYGDDGGIHVASEWRWDARQSGPLDDVAQAQKIVMWAKAHGANPNSLWIVDPAAPNLGAALNRVGVREVQPGYNDVISGIRAVTQAINMDWLTIDSNCLWTIKEMSNYEWDEAMAEKNEDRPVKRDDHGADAIRYMVATTNLLRLKGRTQVLSPETMNELNVPDDPLAGLRL